MAPRWTRDEARGYLAELDRSAQSVASLAAELGVSTQRFWYWRDVFAREGTETPPSPPKFVEISLPRGPVDLAIEVRYPSGHVVEVRGSSLVLADVLRSVAAL